MIFTDEMKESYRRVEQDLKELKEIGSKKLQAKLDHLEADVCTFLDAVAEAMDVWDAEELSEYELFDLYYQRLTGLAEELCALGRKRPESVCNSFKIRQVNQILLFCMDQPRSITEIGRFLGYAEKKTTRKYLNPLLEEGLIGRTVPDKPNSRNQRCITLRTV